MSIKPHIGSRGISDRRENAPGAILCEIAVRKRIPIGDDNNHDDTRHHGTLELRQAGINQVQLAFWHEDGGLLWQQYHPTREEAEQAACCHFNVHPSRWAKDGVVPSAAGLRFRKFWSGLRRLVAALKLFRISSDGNEEMPKGCLTYAASRAPDETPSGIECSDSRLLRFAYAAMEALDDDRLGEGKQLVDQLVETYPDCLWGYELHDRYLMWSRDLYDPENRIDTNSFLKESIRNLEHMLTLNPNDLPGGYFIWSTHSAYSLHLQLARLHCDAAWEAGSEHDAQAALNECRRHLAAWCANVECTSPAESQRICQADDIELLCVSAVEAWTKTGGRVPGEADKMPDIDEKHLAYINCELRWPWKAGLVPNITYNRVVCQDSSRLRLTHAVWESLAYGRNRRAKRLLDVLIARYPECIWGYELYDFYIQNDDSFAGLKEKVRNFERMLALNPEDDGGGPEGFFEGDICIRDNLMRCACEANWAAPTEQEAREMQAVCLREIAAEQRQLLASRQGDDGDDSVDYERNPLALRCSAVMTAWAEAGGVPSEAEKRAVLDRMETFTVLPCRVLELLEKDIVAVDKDGTREEILVFLNDVAVGDFVGVDIYGHGITKLDPERAMAILAETGKC